MPVSPLCKARIHDWGPSGGKPGAVCVREGCGKEFGQRSKAAGTAPPLGSGRIFQAQAPSASGAKPTALASSESLRRAAARISGRPSVPVDAPAAEPSQAAPAAVSSTTAAGATALTPLEDEDNLIADLIRPAGPNLLVNGSASLINHGAWIFKPRKALEPDPDFMATFVKRWNKGVERLVPKIELHPVVALLLAAGAVTGSMWWAAPVIEEKPALPAVPKHRSEERDACPPSPPSPVVQVVAASADMPVSVPSSSNGLTPLSPIRLDQLETSATIGNVDDAEQDA